MEGNRLNPMTAWSRESSGRRSSSVISCATELASNGDRKLGVAQGDIYQMRAYAQAYDARRLVLLYPWLEGVERGAVRRWRVVGTERKLEIAAVDVGEPRSVVCALREIVGVG